MRRHVPLAVDNARHYHRAGPGLGSGEPGGLPDAARLVRTLGVPRLQAATQPLSGQIQLELEGIVSEFRVGLGPTEGDSDSESTWAHCTPRRVSSPT